MDMFEYYYSRSHSIRMMNEVVLLLAVILSEQQDKVLLFGSSSSSTTICSYIFLCCWQHLFAFCELRFCGFWLLVDDTNEGRTKKFRIVRVGERRKNHEKSPPRKGWKNLHGSLRNAPHFTLFSIRSSNKLTNK